MLWTDPSVPAFFRSLLGNWNILPVVFTPFDRAALISSMPPVAEPSDSVLAEAEIMSLMKNRSEDDVVDMPRLTPAQDVAYNVLEHALKAGDLLLLTSHAGRGRTTVLRRLREDTGGGFVTSKE